MWFWWTACGTSLRARHWIFMLAATRLPESGCFSMSLWMFSARMFQELAAPARDLRSRARPLSPAPVTSPTSPLRPSIALMLRTHSCTGLRRLFVSWDWGGSGRSPLAGGPLGCYWNFSEAQKQFCSHLAVFSAKRLFLFLTFLAQKSCDPMQRSTSIHRAAFAPQNENPPSVRLSPEEPQRNHLPLSGFINDEMSHSVFLSGKRVKAARIPGKVPCLQLHPCYKSFI